MLPIYHVSNHGLSDGPTLSEILDIWGFLAKTCNLGLKLQERLSKCQISNHALHRTLVSSHSYQLDPVGYSFVHKGSLLRVAYDLQPVVKCSWSFLELCNSCGAGRICRNRVSKSRTSEHIPSFWHPLQFLTNGKNMTSTLQNIGISVSCCSLKLSPFVHETLGEEVVRCLFKYPANIVGKICPPLATPTMSRILPHLVGALVQSTSWPQCSLPTKVVFPSPFCFFFSPRTTFKGHVKKHTGISLVISPPNPKKKGGKRGYPLIHAKNMRSSSFLQRRSRTESLGRRRCIGGDQLFHQTHHREGQVSSGLAAIIGVWTK